MSALWTIGAALLALSAMISLTLGEEKMRRSLAIDATRLRLLKRWGVAAALATLPPLWPAYGGDSAMAITAALCLLAGAGIVAIFTVGLHPRHMLGLIPATGATGIALITTCGLLALR